MAYQIKCFDKIAKCGLDALGEKYSFTDDIAQADVALVRSSSLHEANAGEKLFAVARAGAGVNNIPVDKFAEKGIVVFNTPGANANAVKELVIAALLLASRDIIDGVNWVKTIESDISKTVEKGKKAFAGKEIAGKKLGVIGLGAIGVLVANSAISLGMTVYGYDVSLSIEHALALKNNVVAVKSLDEMFAECDYITVHVPLLDSTKYLFNADAFAKMKDGVSIINFSRDLLVNDDDMRAALASGKVHRYVTDFPNEKVRAMAGVIVVPHLGASTTESEDNCAVMAVTELMAYVSTGSIKNSVNFPELDAGSVGEGYRIAVLHKNVPNMIGQFTALLGKKGINIVNMANKSKGNNAYTVIDTETDPAGIAAELSAIENVYRVRTIQ
ncbi:MAG: 3-phosphoglycerate dehydrogenase [Clostridiales bacterium]|nr:MAG: 3-phosphoglycerate dehydrogenase [Clostridiales bacterium]